MNTTKTPNRAQRAFQEKPFTARELARKMARGRKMSPRQLDNAAHYLLQVLRRGGASEDYATRLGRWLGIEGIYLQLPPKCWPREWR